MTDRWTYTTDDIEWRIEMTLPKICLDLVGLKAVTNININICSIELKWDGKITKIW